MKKKSEILVLNSNTDELNKVEPFLLAFFKKYDLPINYFNKVLLCISEAIVNSIQHGNKFDSRKQVLVMVRFEKNVITIEISDDGDGFDFENVANPTKINNIKQESGRGIFIIKSLCEEIHFKNHGNCIQFKMEFT